MPRTNITFGEIIKGGNNSMATVKELWFLLTGLFSCHPTSAYKVSLKCLLLFVKYAPDNVCSRSTMYYGIHTQTRDNS